jgi:nickel/cobalt transporter (NicO) family protein
MDARMWTPGRSISMQGLRRSPLAVLFAALLFLLPTTAGAHPLGNFSVNRYSRIDVGRDSVQLRYVLDLAEIPTLQELQAAGIASGPTAQETVRGLEDEKAARLASGAQLTVDGRPVTWTIQQRSVKLVPGQADLDTMRVELTLTAPLAPTEGSRVEYRDTNFAGRVGWHEVVLRGIGGVGLVGSGVPTRDQTDELRQYPADPSRAPLDISAAVATLSLVGAVEETQPSVEPVVRVARLALDPTASVLSGFLRQGTGPGPLAVVLALVVAALLGALHALEPGHGKTLVGGYLVGARGTPRHALLLGLTVTATHTIGVYALGLVTLVAAQYVLPERLYPILGVISGLLLVGVGVSLARTRFREAFATGNDAHAHHDHPHDEGHAHSHDHDHDHLHPHGHELLSHHEHVHDHEEHGHLPTVIRHSHGGHEHTHGVPGGDGTPITMRSLLALGISGGLLPCPSALVVLLAAVSFQNVGLGLALVAAFSAGLAAVLTGLGLAIVYGGRLVRRTSWAGQVGQWPVVRAMPALSALAITVAGLAIAAQAARAFA